MKFLSFYSVSLKKWYQSKRTTTGRLICIIRSTRISRMIGIIVTATLLLVGFVNADERDDRLTIFPQAPRRVVGAVSRFASGPSASALFGPRKPGRQTVTKLLGREPPRRSMQASSRSINRRTRGRASPYRNSAYPMVGDEI